MPSPPAPISYRLLGPPDLLHDLVEDFGAIGWRTSAQRWKAVVTAPPEDAGHTAPEWPTEVTLVERSPQPHEQACAEFFS